MHTATAALPMAGAARLMPIVEQDARVRSETVVQTAVPAPAPQPLHPNRPRQLPHPNLSHQPPHQRHHRQQLLLQRKFQVMLPAVRALVLLASTLSMAIAALRLVGAAAVLRTVVLVARRAMVLAPKLGSLLEKEKKVGRDIRFEICASSALRCGMRLEN